MSGNDGRPAPRPNPTLLYCHFCGKMQNEVAVLIAGPLVFICDECVDRCVDVIKEQKIAKAATAATPDSKEDGNGTA